MAFSSSFFTAATISGPALGGFLYALGPVYVYSICISGFIGAALIVSQLGGGASRRNGQMRRVMSGWRKA